MKRLFQLVTVFICLNLLFLTVSAASDRASQQIRSYRMDAYAASSREICIEFSVTGVGVMKELGAEKIAIYEKDGSKWNLVNSLHRDDLDMTASNTYTYGNSFSCKVASGNEYRVNVTIFAEDKGGNSDRRTQQFFINT